MEADPSLAEEIITNMERVEEDGHMLSDKDEAIQRLAFQVQVRIGGVTLRVMRG